MTGRTQLETELGELRVRLEDLAGSTVRIFSGSIAFADTTGQTATVQVPGQGGLVTLPAMPVLGNYIPAAGQDVFVLLNGSAPIVMPPAQPIVHPAPAQVTGLTVAGGIGALVISWAAIIDAGVKWNRGYYTVQVDTANTFATGNLKSFDVAANRCNVSGLTTGTTYYVRVRAVNYTGEVSALWSSTVTGLPTVIQSVDVGFSTTGVPIVSSLPTLPNATYPIGSVVSLTTDGKLYRNVANVWTAAVPTVDLTGQIQTAQIANDAVTAGQIAADAVTASEIQALAVGTAELQATAVTTAKIAADAVTAVEIATAAIGTLELGPNVVTTAKIAADAVTAAEIAADAVGATEIAALAVGSAELAANSVILGKIATDAVDTAAIVADAVTASEIAALAVGSGELAAGAVIAGKITAGTIVTGDIAASTITGGNIAATTITGSNIAATTIAAGKLVANTITAAQIAASTITTTEILANTILAGDIAAGTITTTEIAANTITAGDIQALTITAAEIAANTITGGKIVAGTITTTEILANTILAADIAAGTITTTEIAALTIQAGDIQALTITAGEIAASTITGAKIAAATIAAGNIVGNTITASQIAAGTITTAEIAANTITAGDIFAGTITATELAADSVTTNKILAGQVTAAKIASHTITANEIAALTITAAEIAANTITAAKIFAGTITTTEIAANTITAGDIAANTITSTEITALSLVAGRYIRSTSYAAGLTGWTIEADGSAEFNNVTVRGTVAASTVAASVIQSPQTALTANGNAETAFTPVEILPNTNFDTNTTGWTGINSTLLRITATPAPQAGTGSMRMTAVATGDQAATTPTGTGGFAVTPGDQYLATAYFRTLVTSRSCRVSIVFYTAAGTLLPAGSYGEQGWLAITDTTSTWQQQTSRAFVPPRAAFAAVKLSVYGCSAGEQHAVDTISFKKELTGVGNGAGVSNNANQSYVTRDTGTFHSGAASWKVNAAPGGAGTTLVLKTSVSNIVEGSAYVMQSWVRRGGSVDLAVRPFAQWIDSAGNKIIQPVWPPPRDTPIKNDLVTSTWNQIEFVFTAPAGTVAAVLMLFCDTRLDGSSAGNDSFFVDDLIVYRDTAMVGGSVLAEFVASNTEVWDQTGPVMPVGSVVAWAGPDSYPPVGWLVCGGYSVNIVDFPRLYMTIGVSFFEWGVAPAGTFWIPDLRGRIIVGRDNMAAAGASYRQQITHGGGQTLGGYGGDQHFQSHIHDIREYGGYQSGGGQPNAFSFSGSTFGATTEYGGVGTGDNMPPVQVLNFIIKT